MLPDIKHIILSNMNVKLDSLTLLFAKQCGNRFEGRW